MTEPDGRRGGDAPRFGRCAGFAVPQPFAWRAQPCLSSRRRQYRLDRSRAGYRPDAPPRRLCSSRRLRGHRTAMEISELLTPRSVVAQLRVTGKKQALQEIARRAATMTGVKERRIYEGLSERERLGTTGIGRGVAIPHGKLGELTRVYGLFARLDRQSALGAMPNPAGALLFVL